MLANRTFNLLQILVDLIYPKLCMACNDNLSKSEDILCVACKSNLPVIEPEFSEILLRKKLADINPSLIMSFLLYKKGNVSQELLYAFKYEGRKQIGMTLSRWFAYYIRENFDTSKIDVIIPVPLHPKKLRKRGFNQSGIIAGEISGIIDKPNERNILIRKRSSVTQTKKSRTQRMTTVNKIFDVKNEQMISGKHILLIDDVITTGSTLSACSEVLKKAGAATISIATLTAAK